MKGSEPQKDALVELRFGAYFWFSDWSTPWGRQNLTRTEKSTKQGVKYRIALAEGADGFDTQKIGETVRAYWARKSEVHPPGRRKKSSLAEFWPSTRVWPKTIEMRNISDEEENTRKMFTLPELGPGAQERRR